MIIIQEHTVPKDIQGVRLLDYALDIFRTVPSRSAMKKVIKRCELLVNGQPGNQSMWVYEGLLISLVDLEQKPPKPLDIKLEIVFEDEHLAIINKPAGIEVSGNKYYTIQNALITNITPSSEDDALKWPRPLHRLDMPTSGLLMIAKTASALMRLGQQFENREVQKKYLAIVAGYLPDDGDVTSDINEQRSLSTYKCITRYHSLKTTWISLTELCPHTGRTHQLRIHMAEIGFPVVGDRKYGTGPLLKGKGLFLAAVKLSFIHPATLKPMDISIVQPKKFDGFIERQEQNWKKHNTV